VISHKHKYIFIHIPKTGGSSVERALLINENVITSDTPIFLLKSVDEKTRDKYKLQILKNNQIVQQSHYPLDKFDLELQNNYYCFTFVRNPWDLVVSVYEFSKQYRYKMVNVNFSFEDFLLKDKIKAAPWHMLPQHSFINENINFIGKFENLQEDFDKICKNLNLQQQKLPHILKTKRIKYQDYYTEETKNFVAVKYKKDIEMFNYKF
jgi:hypothetical protein